MALVDATRAKLDPNLRSLSQIRYFGACPYGVASRSCCAIQGSVGDRVTPTWITLRVLSEGVEEGEERSKEEISHLQKVASPDLCGVIVQKGCPPLSPWLRSANSPHVFLDGALAHMNTQFQQFPTNPLSAPEPILRRHFSDQCDSFRRYLGLVRRGL